MHRVGNFSSCWIQPICKYIMPSFIVHLIVDRANRFVPVRTRTISSIKIENFQIENFQIENPEI